MGLWLGLRGWKVAGLGGWHKSVKCEPPMIATVRVAEGTGHRVYIEEVLLCWLLLSGSIGVAKLPVGRDKW